MIFPGATGLPNLEMLEQMVTQQAAEMAYSNDFLLMTLAQAPAKACGGDREGLSTEEQEYNRVSRRK